MVAQIRRSAVLVCPACLHQTEVQDQQGDQKETAVRRPPHQCVIHTNVTLLGNLRFPAFLKGHFF